MAKKAKKVEVVKFPIERDIVIWNNTYHKQIKRGSTVKCVFCGQNFIVNSKTVFMFDGMEFVTCPECTRKTDVCYYFDRVIKDAPANYVEEEDEVSVDG